MFLAITKDGPDPPFWRSAIGGFAKLAQFTTDLAPHPQLNANGELEFAFGARLIISGSHGGNYRERIPISVDYN